MYCKENNETVWQLNDQRINLKVEILVCVRVFNNFFFQVRFQILTIYIVETYL